jgi:hypothetical protein
VWVKPEGTVKKKMTKDELEDWYQRRCGALEADIVFLARAAGNTMRRDELLQRVRDARSEHDEETDEQSVLESPSDTGDERAREEVREAGSEVHGGEAASEFRGDAGSEVGRESS